MRKATIFFLVLVGFLLVACSAKQPAIALETAELDLGNVTNGEVVVREVTVRNEGEADLVVDEISASCSCTSPTLSPMTIPPGGSGTLHIEFDSGFHGPDLNGALVRQVFVVSNDPQ